MEATILFPTVASMPSAPYNIRKMSSGLVFLSLCFLCFHFLTNSVFYTYVSCLSHCLQWLPSRRWWQLRPSPPTRSQSSPPMPPPSRRSPRSPPPWSPTRSPPPPPPPCFLCLYTTRAGQLTFVTLLSLSSC